MERPLTQKALDEQVAELEERFDWRLKERIAQVISDLGLGSQQSES